MSESQKELPVVGTRRRRGISRRAFIVGAAGVAALGAEALSLGVTPKKVVEFLIPPEGRPKDEQVKAAGLLAEQKPEEFVYNIVAIGEKNAKGQIVPVNIRNKPTLYSPGNEKEPSSRVGDVLGNLQLNKVIPRARVVWGDHRDSPYDLQRLGRWFTFEDPGKPGRVVFAYEAGFRISDSDYDKYSKIQPVDIQNRLSKKSDKGLR